VNGGCVTVGHFLRSSLSGTGAENWAKAHGVEMCDKQDMVSGESKPFGAIFLSKESCQKICKAVELEKAP